MLNIYYAGESTDKAKFIFTNIKSNEGRSLLIVPDQFSAQTERNAFFYLGKKATMDLRVFHFERLGQKAIEEVGVPVPALIDKYGRHMLLTNIIRREEKEENLTTYKGMSEKNTFVTMMNSLISELKRNEVGPEDLEGAIEQLDDNSFLKRKLSDIKYIFEEYEKDIADKYLDSEDYITFYGDVIGRAPLVEGADVWIYGFDTFTAKNMLVIDRLVRTAKSVNIVMNYDEDEASYDDAGFLAEDDRRQLFSLTGYVISKLEELAVNAGSQVRRIPMDGEPKSTVWSREADICDKFTLVGASNVYEEAERAAEYVLSLVRDQDYRYGDIVVVCNDMTGLGAVLKRTLDKWGIPAFVDNKRNVLHHPAVGFVIALMDIAADGFKVDSAMRLLKSGLMDYDSDVCELLENYTYVYKIRGNGWKTPFAKKTRNMTEEELIALNEVREAIALIGENAKAAMGQRNSAEEKIKGLYRFLMEDFGIIDKLENLMAKQTEAGLIESADETAQSWNVICSIFEQVVSIMGDKKISNVELKKLIVDGLEEIQIGLVPGRTDSVIIGALQRTRLSRTRALLVVGANEGVLPIVSSDEGILSDNEKEILDKMNLTVGKTDAVMHGEESLAIYRNLTAPEEKLYMSYAKTNSKGEEIKQSHVFDLLKEYVEERAGKKVVQGDLDGSDVMNLVNSPEGTLPRVAAAMRQYRDEGEIDEQWMQVINWYMDHDSAGFAKMHDGMQFSNRTERLEEDLADALYIGDRDKLQVSASRLEKYSGCPFAHFMNYGIRLEELEPYGISSSESGNIYHECLMRLSRRLMPTDGSAINGDTSPWMSIDDAKCKAMVEEIITKELSGTLKDVINASEQDNYRSRRIIDICSKAAMSMIHQVQKGQIDSMAFEKEFDSRSNLKPISIQIGDREVLLTGKIDRLDILNVEDGEQAVRIVDYKTGHAEIKKEYYEAGYKLQLMVYLNAALNGDEKLIPAGVFHFKIDEIQEENDNGKVTNKSLGDRFDKGYKLQGFVLGEEPVIKSMDGEYDDESTVINVKKVKKDGSLTTGAGGKIFTRDEFAELCQVVNEQVTRICGEIVDGVIDVAPKKTKDTTACKYCGYKSICLFDTSFKGCRYDKV